MSDDRYPSEVEAKFHEALTAAHAAAQPIYDEAVAAIKSRMESSLKRASSRYHSLFARTFKQAYGASWHQAHRDLARDRRSRGLVDPFRSKPPKPPEPAQRARLTRGGAQLKIVR